MATPLTRPDSDIQGKDGRITGRWNSYFSNLETLLFSSLLSKVALPAYANDAAAAAGGVPLYGYYQASGVVRQRIV